MKQNHDELVESDYVMTPEWCAKDMIQYFNPIGKILDPCRGLNKVFHNLLPIGTDYCEIQEGINFFDYDKQVDWIVGNPPYSIFNDWMEKSFEISENILYLVPTFKIFNALGLCRMYKDKGWIKHIRFYDTGKNIEWSRSRPIVAVHFQQNYVGDTSWSHFID